MKKLNSLENEWNLLFEVCIKASTLAFCRIQKNADLLTLELLEHVSDCGFSSYSSFSILNILLLYRSCYLIVNEIDSGKECFYESPPSSSINRGQQRPVKTVPVMLLPSWSLFVTVGGPEEGRDMVRGAYFFFQSSGLSSDVGMEGFVSGSFPQG